MQFKLKVTSFHRVINMQTFSSCNLKQTKLRKSSFSGEVFTFFFCISVKKKKRQTNKIKGVLYHLEGVK